MKMNILIVQNKKVALHVAAAYSGIIQGTSLSLSPEEIRDDFYGSLSNVRGESYVTHIDGNETLVVWSSNATINFEKTPRLSESDLPYLEDTSFSLSEKWISTIEDISKKYEVDTITIALQPSIRTAIFCKMLPERFPKQRFTITYLFNLTVEGIRASINSATFNKGKVESAYSRAISQKTIEDLVRANIATAMKSYKNLRGSVDQYILTALFHLEKMTNKQRQTNCRVIAEFEYNDKQYTAKSEELLTKDQADNFLVAARSAKLITKKTLSLGLPTTASMFSVFKEGVDADKYVKGQLEKKIIALYEKGMITYPITLNNKFPYGFCAKDFKTLSAICESNGEKIPTSFDKISTFTTSSKDVPGCILPLQKDCDHLSPDEKKIYKSIIIQIANALSEKSFSAKRFTVDGEPYTFVLKDCPAEMIGESFEAHFRIEDEDVPMDCNIEEYMQQLNDMKLGTGDILLSLPDRLSNLGMILYGSSTIVLTKDGQTYCDSYPLEAFKTPDMCLKWDYQLRHEKNTSAVVENAKEEIKKWVEIFKHKEIDTSKDNYPTPPASTVEPAAAPHEELSIKSESDETRVTIDGTVYILTPEDKVSLERGEKILHLGADIATGEISQAYLYQEGKTIKESHETNIPCPCCGQMLKFDEWGFLCDSCGFCAPKEIYGKELSSADVSSLITTGKTGWIEGLLDPATGKTFAGYITIKENGQIFISQNR